MTSSNPNELAPRTLGARDGLDELIRHVVEGHHRYVRETTPVVLGWLDTLIDIDRASDRHPALVDVRETFRQLSDTLGSHMAKEEHILFPFIQDLEASARTGARPAVGPFGALANPIRVMEADHLEAESLVDQLRSLTHGYAVPADASPLHRRCYEELARFEEDLERHVHLENDVLFPAAIALEGRVGWP